MLYRWRGVCFNPRPIQRPGDTCFAKLVGLFWIVSIRARSKDRAIQDRPQPCRGLLLFQSAPDPKTGRYPLAVNAWPDRDTFQSAPDPKTGRYYRPSI